MSLVVHLHRVVRRENLSPDEAEQAMLAILSGQATSAQIAGFLTALRMKGETAEEIYGFARAMRMLSQRVVLPQNGRTVLDTCGTGGDGRSTFNISTVAAFVVAGAGVPVAKHGNRSFSSRCGSADVLEALGVSVTLDHTHTARALAETGIAFLFAPAFHPAIKFAQPVRAELGMRTAFNFLGPLTNPAGAQAQLVGTWSREAAELIARALGYLNVRRALVVNGSDGLDEITTTGPTTMLEVQQGIIASRTLTPDDFGVALASLADLAGGDPQHNAEIARAVLGGASGPQRDIVLVNAAAALVAAGAAQDWSDGMAKAAASIDSGAAREKCEGLARFSQAAHGAGR
jgi:anthranilate phosphoribosyltransferase